MASTGSQYGDTDPHPQGMEASVSEGLVEGREKFGGLCLGDTGVPEGISKRHSSGLLTPHPKVP